MPNWVESFPKVDKAGVYFFLVTVDIFIYQCSYLSMFVVTKWLQKVLSKPYQCFSRLATFKLAILNPLPLGIIVPGLHRELSGVKIKSDFAHTDNIWESDKWTIWLISPVLGPTTLMKLYPNYSSVHRSWVKSKVYFTPSKRQVIYPYTDLVKKLLIECCKKINNNNNKDKARTI